jgi:CheY-like chemotaxis protein
VNGDLGFVRGDAHRLQQILGNLLGNAIKFTPRGGRIVVSGVASPSHVDISVRDTGVGIRPALIERIFDRFSQADTSMTRSHGGLGLGLAIANELSELHGGSLSAFSAGEGQGATFTLRLPRLVGQRRLSDRPQPLSESAAVSGQPPGLNGIRVLAVDDQEDALELVAHVLRAAHAEVVTLASAEEALKLVANGRDFDVILCDVGMPGRDGYSLMRELRSRGVTIPAVAMTAFVGELDRDASLLAGFQHHLAKPVQPKDLIAMVRSISFGKQAPDR